MFGHMGKILRVNLTAGEITTIDTSKYEQWIGGHGMGSAIFWDLCKDKAIDAFDPRNVVTIMTSPLTGTLTPAASSRTEVQAISPLSYPINWFSRGNFGGRFGAMLKYAGWDGIVIEGKADKPVWIDIRDRKDGERLNVTIRDASWLWGSDTWETQEEIWREVANGKRYGDWLKTGPEKMAGRTTQRPAVLTIGKARENLGRDSALIHDAGDAVGNCGIGGVWGSKNLKAISVLGTGSVDIANPSALMEGRMWFHKEHAYNVDKPLQPPPKPNNPAWGLVTFSPGMGQLYIPFTEPARPNGCLGCHALCRRHTASGRGNESQCDESMFYSGKEVAATTGACDLAQRYGLSAYHHGQDYCRSLYKMGVLGKGKAIDCDLNFEDFGSLDFAKAYFKMVVERQGIGNDLLEGTPRAAKKWGRWEDIESGLARYPNWGYKSHYEARAEVEWSYGSIFGDRDINEHGVGLTVHWVPLICKSFGKEPFITAEEMTRRCAAAIPGANPKWFDYSDQGIYTDDRVAEISWHRHYNRFWIQSALYCDWAYPRFYDTNNPNGTGNTPESEPKFMNAVTGKSMTYEDGVEIGKKIWNLDKAIWVLQGRHRDQEVFSKWVYEVGVENPYWLPVYENGKWDYSDCKGRKLDRAKFEDFKTRFYKFEGWDPATGWPTRRTLESMGLGQVADELEKKGKLGKG